MTWTDQLLDMIHNKALEKGIEKGIEKGQEAEIQRARSRMLRLLQLRFQDVPDTVEARVETATDAELDVWTERILLAESIDELVAESDDA